MEKEFLGKDVESAIKKGLNKLKLTKDEVKIKILDEGKKGLFGLMGAIPARIKIIKTNADINMELASKKAYELTVKFIKEIDNNATVSAKKKDRKIAIDIKSKESALIIGKNGATLTSLEYIVNLAMKKNSDTRINVIIDIGGYKSKKIESSVKKFEEAVKQVIASGNSFILEPMDARERKAIHEKAKQINNIETKSSGVGDSRRVVIKKV